MAVYEASRHGACVLRAPPGSHRPVLEAHPGANTFPSVCGLTTTSFTDPFRFPQHLFSVHDHGRQRSGRGPQHTFLPSRRPDCTLSRLRAEEYDRPVTQSIATPEPSSRTTTTLGRTLVVCQSLECVATLGSRRSRPG